MPSIRILIINPNSTQSMTDGLHAPIDSLGYNNTIYTYYTAPHGPPSINNTSDALLSTQACLPTLLPLIPHHDAFLIACYSPHPLLPALKSKTHKPVTGIFEASIAVAVQLLPSLPSSLPSSSSSHLDLEKEESTPNFAKFGIVSTGAAWGPILATAVCSSAAGMLGSSLAASLFAGVETIGLDAGDLHPSSSAAPSPSLSLPESGSASPSQSVSASAPPSESVSTSVSASASTKYMNAEARVRAATRRLLGRGEVRVVVLGCAGMVGMEGWVRGEMEGGRVVDGVKAGVGVLQGLVRGGF